MKKTILITIVVGFAVAGCSNHNSTVMGPQASFRFIPTPPLDPANFVDVIDNPYLPLEAGVTRTYEADTPDGEEVTVDVATPDTKVILGVTTRVVHNTVTLDGSLIEETFEWYAQDKDGNVWYFGEDTKEFEDGQLATTEGSWEAGVDGAEAGIIMLADPHAGDQYIEENAPDVALDEARVISVSRSVEVPYGEFEDCLETKDFTDLEHGVSEFKIYARGVGLVEERDAAHHVIAELVSVE